MRSGTYSDVEVDISLPQCRTVVITGMTLLNFTIDKILHLSKGFNILTGPTAGVHPDFLPNRVKGRQLHAVASIRLDIEKTVIYLKLGGYISLAKHRDLGRPYTFLLQKNPHTRRKDQFKHVLYNAEVRHLQSVDSKRWVYNVDVSSLADYS